MADKNKTAELLAAVVTAVDAEVSDHNDSIGVYNGPDGKPLPKETLDAVQIAGVVKRHCVHVEANVLAAFSDDVSASLTVKPHKYEAAK